MKRILAPLPVILLMVLPVNAQIHLFLEEQELEVRDARSSAWVLPVARGLDEALDDLQEYCKDRSDVRMRKSGENLMVAEKVSIPAISTKRGDLIGYGFITENYYGLALVFQLGYDISLDSKEWNAEMNNFRTYAREFMSYHYEHSYARRIDDLEKEIRSLERDVRQNDNKIENMTRKIGNLNDRIAKETDDAKIEGFKSEITTLEADVSALSDAQPSLRSQIENMHSNVEKLKNESNSYLSAIGSI